MGFKDSEKLLEELKDKLELVAEELHTANTSSDLETLIVNLQNLFNNFRAKLLERLVSKEDMDFFSNKINDGFSSLADFIKNELESKMRLPQAGEPSNNVKGVREVREDISELKEQLTLQLINMIDSLSIKDETAELRDFIAEQTDNLRIEMISHQAQGADSEELKVKISETEIFLSSKVEDIKTKLNELSDNLNEFKGVSLDKETFGELILDSENEHKKLQENFDDLKDALTEVFEIKQTFDEFISQNFAGYEDFKNSTNQVLNRVFNENEQMKSEIFQLANDFRETAVTLNNIPLKEDIENQLNLMRGSFVDDLKSELQAKAESADIEELSSKILGLKENFENGFNNVHEQIKGLEGLNAEISKCTKAMENSLEQNISALLKETTEKTAPILEGLKNSLQTLSETEYWDKSIEKLAICVSDLSDRVSQNVDRNTLSSEKIEENVSKISSHIEDIKNSVSDEMMSYISKSFGEISQTFIEFKEGRSTLLNRYTQTEGNLIELSVHLKELISELKNSNGEVVFSLQKFADLAESFGEKSSYEIGIVSSKLEFLVEEFKGFSESATQMSSSVENSKNIMARFSDLMNNLPDFINNSTKTSNSLKLNSMNTVEGINYIKNQLTQSSNIINSNIKRLVDDFGKTGALINSMSQAVLDLSSNSESIKTREYIQAELNILSDTMMFELGKISAKQNDMENHISELEKKIETPSADTEGLHELKIMLNKMTYEMLGMKKTMLDNAQTSKKIISAERQIGELRNLLISVFEGK